MNIKIRKLHPGAIVPTYGTAGAAAFDLYAATVEKTLVAEPYEVGGDRYDSYRDDFPITAGTGLAFEIPEGYAMFIYSRSGHGFKHGVRLANCVGVIDSDYRGEVMVKLTTDDPDTRLDIASGDRVAQAVILPVPQVVFEVVDELTPTARGTGGFGSTGK